MISQEEIKTEKYNSNSDNEKRSIFYRDINCDISVFDFDVIENSVGLLSMDAFMVNDCEENFLMVE